MTQTVGSTFPGQGVDVFRLDGYVALVTGGGRGIGAGIARAFVLAGADVALVARTASELEDVAAAIRATGRSASIIPADLTDVSQAQLIVERTIAEHGHLDILVNNAGGAMPTPYLDTTPRPSTNRSTSMSQHRSSSPSGRRPISWRAGELRSSTSRREWTASRRARWSSTEPSRLLSPT
jgi:NAD(P)-dependent dehydrogenase (short-subunit alcohol dehydrogenase family)